jgi:hypothetical protein
MCGSANKKAETAIKICKTAIKFRETANKGYHSRRDRMKKSKKLS